MQIIIKIILGRVGSYNKGRVLPHGFLCLVGLFIYLLKLTCYEACIYV